jgi:hypothetical protein
VLRLLVLSHADGPTGGGGPSLHGAPPPPCWHGGGLCLLGAVDLLATSAGVAGELRELGERMAAEWLHASHAPEGGAAADDRAPAGPAAGGAAAAQEGAEWLRASASAPAPAAPAGRPGRPAGRSLSAMPCWDSAAQAESTGTCAGANANDGVVAEWLHASAPLPPAAAPAPAPPGGRRLPMPPEVWAVHYVPVVQDLACLLQLGAAAAEADAAGEGAGEGEGAGGGWQQDAACTVEGVARHVRQFALEQAMPETAALAAMAAMAAMAAGPSGGVPPARARARAAPRETTAAAVPAARAPPASRAPEGGAAADDRAPAAGGAAAAQEGAEGAGPVSPPNRRAGGAAGPPDGPPPMGALLLAGLLGFKDTGREHAYVRWRHARAPMGDQVSTFRTGPYLGLYGY